jgi:hypothetical protein
MVIPDDGKQSGEASLRRGLCFLPVAEPMPLIVVLTFEEYQQRAADCLRVAQETNDPTSKALLLEMAQAWINLAERAKREQDDPTSWTLPDPEKPKE